MRTSIVALVVLASSPAFADAKHDKQMKSLAAAFAKGADAVKPLVKQFPLSIQGLQFQGGGDCELSYGRVYQVDETALAPFVECMKSLKLVFDGGVLVAEPGFEIEALFDGGKLAALISSDRVRSSRTAKQLAATANIAPDAMSLAGVAKKTPLLAVDIALCVGADGAVESANVERYNVVDAGVWADQILATTKATVYKPFTHRGTPMRVCTHQLHVYPAAKRTAGLAQLERLRKEKEAAQLGVEGGEEGGVAGGVEGGVAGGVICCDPNGIDGVVNAPPPPPPPPPPPQIVAPTVLETKRVAGKQAITPDDATKTEITRSGKETVVGTFKLCIDTQGAVTSVTRLKSTGFESYDKTLLQEMRTNWRYSPYVVNGTAVRVCTAITFVYSQTIASPKTAPARR